MPENPISTPASPNEIEEEFFETLRQAAFIFENERNGRLLDQFWLAVLLRDLSIGGIVALSLQARSSRSLQRSKNWTEVASQDSLQRNQFPRKNGSGHQSGSTCRCSLRRRSRCWLGRRPVPRGFGTMIRKREPALQTWSRDM
jgi:hypothetical protein